jgi:hypothetical protein
LLVVGSWLLVAVEEHMFYVARLVQTLQAIGEGFDLIL